MRPEGRSVESLAQALERLNPEERRVLWLRFGQGLEVQSIAGLLGLDEQTVTLLQLRGLQRLRHVWRAGSWAEQAEGFCTQGS